MASQQNTGEIIKNLQENNAFNSSTFFSTAIGIGVGALASFVVNVTLVEISVNSLFALYYGALFLFIGIFVLNKARDIKDTVTTEESPKKKIIVAFGTLMTTSGAICAFFGFIDFFGAISTLRIPHYLILIPFYIILGSSICFAVVFVSIDLINLIGGYCRRMQFRSLVDTPSQIMTMALISFIMGGIYGFIFGLMDIEDAKQHLQSRLRVEERICLAFGALLGAAGGILNEILGRNLHAKLYKQLEKDPFSDEI